MTFGYFSDKTKSEQKNVWTDGRTRRTKPIQEYGPGQLQTEGYLCKVQNGKNLNSKCAEFLCEDSMEPPIGKRYAQQAVLGIEQMWNITNGDLEDCMSIVFIQKLIVIDT